MLSLIECIPTHTHQSWVPPICCTGQREDSSHTAAGGRPPEWDTPACCKYGTADADQDNTGHH